VSTETDSHSVSSDEDSHDDKKKSSKGASSRRKSGGAGGDGKDPVKLNKRKEQNRAAQKAFRERREARVKDVSSQPSSL
jgi:AP-1-like factor